MTFKLKSIIAAGIFAMTCTAQAAILNPVVGVSGDGELFISIFRDTASPESMIIDTDLSLFGLQGIHGPQTTSWTSNPTQTAAIQAFLATAPLSSFRFNAGGSTVVVDDTVDAISDFGFFMTSNTATLTNGPGSASGMNTYRQNTGAFVTEINQGYANTAVITGLNPGEAGYHNSPLGLWGVNGPSTNQNTESLVGTPISLVNYYNASLDPFDYQTGLLQLGNLNIDVSTGIASYGVSVSAVPVPAAVWLFGSGLLGLVGVARRRHA